MATNKFSVYTERDLITIVEGLESDTLNFTIPELKELQAELINRKIDGQQVSTVSNLIMKQMSETTEKTDDKKMFTKRGAALELAEKENIFLTEQVPEEKPEEIKIAEKQAVMVDEPDYDDEEDIEEESEVEEIVAPKKKKEKIAYIEEDEYEDDDDEDYDEYYDEEDEKFPILGFLSVFYKVIGWLGIITLIGAGVIVTFMNDFGKSINIMVIAGCVIVGAIFLLIMTAMAEKISLELEKEKHLRKIRDLLKK